MSKRGYVYILASKRRGTLYIGVTSRLWWRIVQHKRHMFKKSFTARYGVRRLVHYEEYDTIYEAIVREKRLKKWYRSWKIRLIEESNPNWDDLSGRILPF